MRRANNNNNEDEDNDGGVQEQRRVIQATFNTTTGNNDGDEPADEVVLRSALIQHHKKHKKGKKMAKRVMIKEGAEAVDKSDKPTIKFLTMRNLEILVLGSEMSGKSALIHSMMRSEEDQKPYLPKVGMTVQKKEHTLPTGETIRLCFWDPAIRTLPKEKKDNKVLKERAQKNGFVYKLLNGDIWDMIAGNTKEEHTYFLEYAQDTNRELASEYLWSGTYHMAIFTYDLTSAESFEEMEDWLDAFLEQCQKSAKVINYAIVGTKFDIVTDDPSMRAIPQYILNEWMLELEGELSWNDSTVKYFEVDSINNPKSVMPLLRYVIGKGMEKYKLVENRRYMPIDRDVNNRDCGLSCRIF